MVDAGVDGEAERVEGETVTWLGLKPLLVLVAWIGDLLVNDNARCYLFSLLPAFSLCASSLSSAIWRIYA